MFDTDRSGSVNFDEFWYSAYSIIPKPPTNTSQRPLGLPLRMARALRPLRRRPQRINLLRRVQRSTSRIRIPPLPAVRHTAVPHVRPRRAERNELRFIRAGVYQPQENDGRVQEVRRGQGRVYYVELVSCPQQQTRDFTRAVMLGWFDLRMC